MHDSLILYARLLADFQPAKLTVSSRDNKQNRVSVFSKSNEIKTKIKSNCVRTPHQGYLRKL